MGAEILQKKIRDINSILVSYIFATSIMFFFYILSILQINYIKNKGFYI